MNSFNNSDSLRQELKRQNFVRSLANYSNRTGMGGSKTSMGVSVQEILSNIASQENSRTQIEQREEALEEQIKKLEGKIGATKEQLIKSQTSRKRLSEKIGALEKAICLANVIDHPNDPAVSGLTKMLKEYNERVQAIKELEIKEKKMQEGFQELGKLLTGSFSFGMTPIMKPDK